MALPSIDACHAQLTALSCEALDCVAAHDAAPAAKELSKKPRKVKKEETSAGDSPSEVLKTAQRSLAEYDFAGAEELLSSIRISGRDELVFVERAARALVEEVGAYQRAVELLLAQQKQFLRDARLRVLLARAYHLGGALPEARAILDDMQWGELDKEALVAYADIAYKDGNLVLAQKLLKGAEETEGYAGGTCGLKKPPNCLTTKWVLAQFAETPARAQKRYREFVKDGIDRESIWKDLKCQVLLGDDAFVSEFQMLRRVWKNCRKYPKGSTPAIALHWSNFSRLTSA